jgi:hypothetical protein
MLLSRQHGFKHCHICGRRLWGRAYVHAPNGVVDEHAIVVCRRCWQAAPHCAVCGAPMSDTHIRLPDERHICPRCHQTAVYDAARGRELFERVAHIVTEELGLRLNVGTEFTMVDHQHLQRLARASRNPYGNPAKVIGLFAHKGHKRLMYVLSGLPQILLIQTIAHEWAHAWHGENCPLFQDPLLQEGFAEWVAYKTLQTMGAVKKMQLMEQRDGLYGEGLRKMLRLEQERDVPGVLDFCRRAR